MAQLPKIIDNNRRSMHDTISDILPQFDEISIATGYRDLD